MLNPELLDANQLKPFFRVNSVFHDPNVFGRYLALALIALGACVAWSRDSARPRPRRDRRGRLPPRRSPSRFSITSFAALLAGLGIVALLRWSWRGAAGGGGVPRRPGRAAGRRRPPTSDIQTDRTHRLRPLPLVEGGLILAGASRSGRGRSGATGAARGLGLGRRSARAFFEQIEPERTDRLALRADHRRRRAGRDRADRSTWRCSARSLVVAARRAAPGARRRAAPSRRCFVAMLVHSFGYAGFLIDPATWALLALGVALRGPRARASAG